MSVTRWSGRFPLLAAAGFLAAAAAGCSLFTTTHEGARTSVDTGDVVLTATGARTVLRGDTASLSEAVEDMFDNLDIYLVGEGSSNGGKQMRGRLGTAEVLVDLVPEPEQRVEVSVRVRDSGSGAGQERGRWNRNAARGLLEEIRRWAAQ